LLLERKIQRLCEKVIAAANEVEAEEAAAELREALHEHIETLRGNILLTSYLPAFEAIDSSK